jgi:FkbM family methyltransferase
MAGIKQRAFQTLLDGRSLLLRAGLDRIAQCHPRMESAFRRVYHPVYRLLQPGGMMTAEIGGVRISADTSQRDLMLLLRRESGWEFRQTRLIASLLAEGMVFVDVGAHIGLYTLLAARRVGPQGKVFAFEPAPENFRVLKYNIAQNELANVTAELMAVTRARGRATFTLSEKDSASHTLAGSLQEGRKIETETISLDEYFAGCEPRIGVIKVDAEGAELGILEGMQGILSRHPELTLFTEIYPRAMEAFGSSPAEYLVQLDAMGFAIVPFDEAHHGEMRLERDGFADFLESLRARGEGTNLLCRRRKAAKTFAGGTRQEEPGRKRVVEMEARRPLISIAIPTYNRGALLETALASILPQIRGREDVEVVVLDTGSVDDTGVRMARLAREHEALRFFSFARRQNLDEALLLLLERCRGEYVWFFSSDDQMKPGALEMVRRRILAARARPALVYVNQEIVDESGETLIVSQVGKEGDRDFRDGRQILPWLGLNLGFISASVIRRESALRATSAHEFLGTRSLNLHLYLRCLLEGGAALYLGKPLVRARRASGAPPYEYADVFVRDIVRILEDARQRGFGRLAIYRAMHGIVAGQYLRLVISWRADDPLELARTFPVMARACWKYPAFWLLLLPARLAPAGVLRRIRNALRGWRRARNQRHDRPEAEHTGVVRSAAVSTKF